jgi:hypothetical protein
MSNICCPTSRGFLTPLPMGDPDRFGPTAARPLGILTGV